MDEETVFFEISENGNSIRINLISFSHPNAVLDWDRNWVKGLVEVKAGAFSGKFKADFMTIDFANLKNELAELYYKLVGTAKFTPLENQVNITIIGDGIGHLKAECEVTDDTSFGSRLQFEIDFDQTHIPPILKQLERVVSRFPKIGELK